MPRPEVLDEYAAILSRCIMKVKSSRKIPVDKNKAFRAGVGGRGHELLPNPIASGKQNKSSLDCPSKALAGRLADFGGSIRLEGSAFSSVENRLGPKMFRVAFKTGGGGKDVLFFA